MALLLGPPLPDVLLHNGMTSAAIWLPSNQRPLRARQQFAAEVMAKKRTYTSPRVLYVSTHTISTEPYFRHSCSTSA